MRVGNLYYLNCLTEHQQANARQSKEDVWYPRNGRLGVQNLQKLAKEELMTPEQNGVTERMNQTLVESVSRSVG